MIGEEELDSMKNNAFLISASRGGIVDEYALYKTLRQKKIAGAALDVFKDEPPKGNPLLLLDNFIATPHMAGFTYEAINRIGMVVAENIVNVTVKSEKAIWQVV
ncbi:hypothetical protein KFZ58_15610 [Virgibacillus sp. NKC19-16]|nr:NAD(P)-dependent oxidoreductase [Virgibacillus sp. NKC19-16]UJL45794.1 hypothetical protein KFZ58_15610 [Virgibacillus sp. NKC19-16]